MFFKYFKQHQQCFSDGDDISYVTLPDDLQEFVALLDDLQKYLYTCLFNLDFTAFQKDQRGEKHYN